MLRYCRNTQGATFRCLCTLKRKGREREVGRERGEREGGRKGEREGGRKGERDVGRERDRLE